jgi:dipeptide transport system permease protein
MIAYSMEVIRGAWWQSAFPGIAIIITVLGFNLLGDGLRDALDPRLRE